MSDFYVTTAIPYVNAAPHLGHALELVQADVLARHRRARGDGVRFLTGTDDNALKNVTAARAAGVDVLAFVTANADRFAALRSPLSLSPDDFIRTGTDPRHAAGVTRLWRETAAAGDLYRRRYTGRYCAGCEQFWTAAELPGGVCPEHGVPPEEVTEENWFFRLSRWTGALLDAVGSGRLRIEPAARRNEVLGLLRGGLHDISVSRPAARAGGWGVPVPGDPDQVVYVWWDALANYVTALGAGGPAYRRWWVEADERVHVVGKGILRFHAVYWPALLLSTGRPLPSAVFVHDYLTVGGGKIAKSAGNAVDPVELVRRYGTDALRWWLLREPARLGDTDFTTARLVHRYDAELAGGLGNLVQRTVTLVHRYRAGRVPASGAAPEICAALPGRIDRALAGFDPRAATDAIRAVVDAGNRLAEAERPWELARCGAADRLDAVLGSLVRLCRAVTGELAPFLPDGAARLRSVLGDGSAVGRAEPVFPRLGG
jgi:methionyl-tRNA synthetase